MPKKIKPIIIKKNSNPLPNPTLIEVNEELK
jgi:hypothetical protein